MPRSVWGMAYSGNTAAGGPADMRETADLEITKLTVGNLGNNCYLLRSRRTGEALLIDAAAEPDRILATMGDGVEQVLTTHGHFDHWGALTDVVAATGATTLASDVDAAMISVPTDITVSDGDKLRVGDVELEALELTGHTPGSIALIHRDSDGSTHVFPGDVLFPGGLGNTWGDTVAFESLFNGVTTKIFDRLPDDTWVYPGHGFDTTLGAERPHLSEWRERGW